MTDGILNFSSNDPFSNEGNERLIHIRVNQRTTRTYVTIIQGLSETEAKVHLPELKKSFHCSGTTQEHPEYGQVVQLSGDQRKDVANFLIQKCKVSKEKIKVHGY